MLRVILCGLISFVATDIFATATGDFWIDIGVLKAAEPSLEAMEQVCADKAPAMTKEMTRAKAAWRQRNKPVLQKVEKAYLTAVRKESKSDRDYLDNLEETGKGIDKMAIALKEKLLDQPQVQIERDCVGYVRFLDSGNFDLAKKYAEELETVTKPRGPKLK